MPKVEITGVPEMHVEVGSSVTIRCVVTNAMLRPQFIFWYRDKTHLVTNAKEGIIITDDVGKSHAMAEYMGSTASDHSDHKDLGKDDLSADFDWDDKQLLPSKARNPISLWRQPAASSSSSYTSRTGKQFMDPDRSHMSKSVYSSLTIIAVTANNSGTYQCTPDNTRPATINLHVIRGR